MKSFSTASIALVLAAPAAFAEGFYGATENSLLGQVATSNEITVEDNEAVGQSVSAFAGYRFASGLFVEGDLRYTNLFSDTGDIGLRYGATGFLRGGYEQGALRGEILFGNADVTSREGTAVLQIAGLGGS